MFIKKYEKMQQHQKELNHQNTKERGKRNELLKQMKKLQTLPKSDIVGIKLVSR